MRVFVTGGAGYIGSHTCVELLNAGYDVVIFDNFSNSKPNAISRIEQITSRKVDLIIGDIRNQIELENALAKYNLLALNAVPSISPSKVPLKDPPINL